MNPFENIFEITVKERIFLPSPHPWRLIPTAPSGAIDNIERCAGFAVATNGILVLLWNPGGTHYIAHLEEFKRWNAIYDLEQPAATPSGKPRKNKIQRELEVCAGKEYV